MGLATVAIQEEAALREFGQTNHKHSSMAVIQCYVVCIASNNFNI